MLNSNKMNIIVKPYGSSMSYCRPDTTWERENRDFYSPECVKEILWTPVVFAKVCKAGKCVGEKFVDRYFDGIGFGAMLYCSLEEGMMTCADHTSVLPNQMFSTDVLEQEAGFVTYINNVATEISLNEAKAALKETICKSSKFTSLRIGDMVAVELKQLEALAPDQKGNVALKGIYNDNEIYNFNIIF